MPRIWPAAAMAALLVASSTHADFLPVFGAPTIDAQGLNGYTGSGKPSLYGGVNINNSGVVVGSAYKVINGEFSTGGGGAAVRWDGSGAPGVELNSLGTDPDGFPDSFAFAINDAGTSVGTSEKGRTDPFPFANSRAVRWEAGGIAVTELGNLGVSTATGRTVAAAYGINTSGTTVGYANTFAAGQSGPRAVRWNAGQTAATELGNIGINTSGNGSALALAINSAGTIVGYGEKFDGNLDNGNRAIRWDAGTNAATELGNLGTTAAGYTNTRATAINDAGAAVGYAEKFTVIGDLGRRAARWDATGTTATELGNLGTDNVGATQSIAYDISAAGTTVGSADKYLMGASIGKRAVRWDATGTTATELGLLPANDPARGFAEAFSINSAGLAVGLSANLNANGTGSSGARAVLWGLDGQAIDLNTLIDPASGWFLGAAYAISDTNWITGTATFDPDGAGSTPTTVRGFLIHVPEPASLGVLTFANALLRRRRA
jgi:hypothetical protein